ncbi:hypothetical protein Riv7116_6220 [Rivularia sp. PCC 7116]|uniref:hypothetical protein n=1 Tax=Rivularia sp. PCC 7116 TaxID=373994 RepID=UPI00029EECD8|nr:hypothetical protein [Rivularia sp. PCC 7116]AFY58569.1 hypothetical protein Riv7116_6220 [Rivularia sp. PCC 7116]
MLFSPKVFARLIFLFAVSLATLPTAKAFGDELPNIDEMMSGLNEPDSILVSSDDIPVRFEDYKNRANSNSEWEVPILNAVSSTSSENNSRPFFYNRWRVPIPNKFTCPNQSGTLGDEM